MTCLFRVILRILSYDGREGSPVYEYYFTFPSVTFAQRSLSELLQKGILAELIRSPKKISSYGCGYAIRVSAADGYTASAVMRTAGVNPVKVLRVYFDGRSEVAGP